MADAKPSDMKYALFLILSTLSAVQLLEAADNFKPSKAHWLRHTFPGEGHLKNKGPWGPYQGSDRTEWVSAFGVHPSNPHFMLQATDLGRLVYTNSELGGVEFIAAELPLPYGSTVAFNPHDKKTGYALMFSLDMPGAAGWWRTIDEGKSWKLMYHVAETVKKLGKPRELPFSPGLYNLLCVNPNKKYKQHIYIGTPTNGVMRSTNNGTSWQTIALPNTSIRSIEISADGKFLYAISGEQKYTIITQAIPEQRSGQLYRINLQDRKFPAEAINGTSVVQLAPHPKQAGAGLMIRSDQLLPFTDYRKTIHQPVLSEARLVSAFINPANP